MVPPVVILEADRHPPVQHDPGQFGAGKDVNVRRASPRLLQRAPPAQTPPCARPRRNGSTTPPGTTDSAARSARAPSLTAEPAPQACPPTGPHTPPRSSRSTQRPTRFRADTRCSDTHAQTPAASSGDSEYPHRYICRSSQNPFHSVNEKVQTHDIEQFFKASTRGHYPTNALTRAVKSSPRTSKFGY